jgi:phosphoglycolate phosphatase-like HAD superfamily hydrolase
MGKPYSREIASLESTYKFCLASDTTGLEDFLTRCRRLPIVCVGSGGSIAVAQYAAMLNEHYSQTVGRASTPLDVANSRAISSSAVLFLTAGGRHPDILGCFRRIAQREPVALAAMCGRAHSPLEALAKQFSFAHYLPFNLPTGKDGFLATNSVLAFSLLLLMAWRRSFGVSEPFPTMNGLDSRVGLSALLRSCQKSAAKAWKFDNFLILHGPWGTPAAIDFESRFHEAGIASVQVADLRNFAHGRHFWLNRKGDQTCVICLTSLEDEKLAAKTLNLLPPDVHRLKVSLGNSGPIASIGLLLVSIHLTAWAADAQALDPGQPRVPLFGRRIYRLNAWQRIANDRGNRRSKILERKTERSAIEIEGAIVGRQWNEALESFLKKLRRARFGALVCDYDGTVCAPEYRYTQPAPAVCQKLNEILGAGLPIGVATGRGKSVRVALRRAIKKRYWNRVVVGYYNGAQVATLITTEGPIAGEPIDDLRKFSDLLREQSLLWRMLRVEERRDQLTLEAKAASDSEEVIRWVRHLIQTCGLQVNAVLSSRSIDIIGKNTSKQSVVHATRALAGSEKSVLCIGDAGAWPGNDFVLLANDYSLSSAFTSPDPCTCWNLAPPGVRGHDATLVYLRSLKVRSGIARIDEKLLNV